MTGVQTCALPIWYILSASAVQAIYNFLGMCPIDNALVFTHKKWHFERSRRKTITSSHRTNGPKTREIEADKYFVLF